MAWSHMNSSFDLVCEINRPALESWNCWYPNRSVTVGDSLGTKKEGTDILSRHNGDFFIIWDEDRGFANIRGEEVEEYLLKQSF